jgi:hypothetical protein
MNEPEHLQTSPHGARSDGRLWLLRTLVALTLVLVFFAYQQSDLLLNWINMALC